MVEACTTNLIKNCPCTSSCPEQAELCQDDQIIDFQEAAPPSDEELNANVSIMAGKKIKKKDNKCSNTDPQITLDKAMRIVSQYLAENSQDLMTRGMDAQSMSKGLEKIHIGSQGQDNTMGLCLSKSDPSAISQDIIENSTPEELASIIIERLAQMQQPQSQKEVLSPMIAENNPRKKAVEERNIFGKENSLQPTNILNPFACNLKAVS